jgi:hypothetical protein
LAIREGAHGNFLALPGHSSSYLLRVNSGAFENGSLSLNIAPSHHYFKMLHFQTFLAKSSIQERYGHRATLSGDISTYILSKSQEKREWGIVRLVAGIQE